MTNNDELKMLDQAEGVLGEVLTELQDFSEAEQSLDFNNSIEYLIQHYELRKIFEAIQVHKPYVFVWDEDILSYASGYSIEFEALNCPVCHNNIDIGIIQDMPDEFVVNCNTCQKQVTVIIKE